MLPAWSSRVLHAARVLAGALLELCCCRLLFGPLVPAKYERAPRFCLQAPTRVWRAPGAPLGRPRVWWSWGPRAGPNPHTPTCRWPQLHAYALAIWNSGLRLAICSSRSCLACPLSDITNHLFNHSLHSPSSREHPVSKLTGNSRPTTICRSTLCRRWPDALLISRIAICALSCTSSSWCLMWCCSVASLFVLRCLPCCTHTSSMICKAASLCEVMDTSIFALKRVSS